MAQFPELSNTSQILHLSDFQKMINIANHCCEVLNFWQSTVSPGDFSDSLIISKSRLPVKSYSLWANFTAVTRLFFADATQNGTDGFANFADFEQAFAQQPPTSDSSANHQNSEAQLPNKSASASPLEVKNPVFSTSQRQGGHSLRASPTRSRAPMYPSVKQPSPERSPVRGANVRASQINHSRDIQEQPKNIQASVLPTSNTTEIATLRNQLTAVMSENQSLKSVIQRQQNTIQKLEVRI